MGSEAGYDLGKQVTLSSDLKSEMKSLEIFFESFFLHVAVVVGTGQRAQRPP